MAGFAVQAAPAGGRSGARGWGTRVGNVLLALAVTVVSMFINARLARRKGRSVFGWVAAAVLLAWISSLVLWVLPSIKRPPATGAVEAVPDAGPLPGDASVSGGDDAVSAWLPPAAAEEDDDGEEGALTCAHCGAELPGPGTLLCPSCGRYAGG